MDIKPIDFANARSEFWQAIKSNNTNNVDILLRQENISFIETTDRFEIASILKYVLDNKNSNILSTLIAANQDSINNIVNDNTLNYFLDKGNVLLASQMLEVRPELACNIENYPLVRSIAAGDLEMTELLLEAKPELANTVETFRAINLIVMRADFVGLKNILAIAPNILDRVDMNNTIDNNFVEAVNSVMGRGNTQMIEFLANLKHDVVAYVADDKVFNQVILKNNINMVKFLLEINPSLKDTIEPSTFIEIIQSGSVKATKFLIDTKPSLIETDFSKEFLDTIRYDRLEMCKFLIQIKPDIIYSKSGLEDNIFTIAQESRGGVVFNTATLGNLMTMGGKGMSHNNINVEGNDLGSINPSAFGHFYTGKTSTVQNDGVTINGSLVNGSSGGTLSFANGTGAVNLGDTVRATSITFSNNSNKITTPSLEVKTERENKGSNSSNLNITDNQNKMTAKEYILQLGNEMFFDLVRDNKIDMVISLIKHNNNLIIKENSVGKTIIQIAVEPNNEELFSALSKMKFNIINVAITDLIEKKYEKIVLILLHKYFDNSSSDLEKLDLLSYNAELIAGGKLPNFNLNYKDGNGDRLIDKAQKLFVNFVNSELRYKDAITSLIQQLRAAGSVEPINPITGEPIGKLILGMLDGVANHDNAVQILNKLYTKYPLSDEQVNHTIESFKQDVDKFVEIHTQLGFGDASVNPFWTAGFTPILGGPLVRGEPLSIVQVIDKLSGLNNVNDRLTVTWDFKKVLGHIIHVINQSSNSELLSVNLVSCLSGLKACVLGKLVNLLYVVQDEVVTNDFDLDDFDLESLSMLTFESIKQTKSADKTALAIHKWVSDLKGKVAPENWSADTIEVQGLFNSLLNLLDTQAPKIFSGYYHNLQKVLLPKLVDKITSDKQLTGVVSEWQEAYNKGPNLAFIEFCQEITNSPDTMEDVFSEVYMNPHLNFGGLDKITVDTVKLCASKFNDVNPNKIEQFLELMYDTFFFTKEVKEYKNDLLKNMTVRNLAHEFEMLQDLEASQEILEEIVDKIADVVFNNEASIIEIIDGYVKNVETSSLGEDDSPTFHA